MSEAEARNLRENVIKGLNQTFEKLVSDKKKTNADLAFSKDGQLKKVKATEI